MSVHGGGRGECKLTCDAHFAVYRQLKMEPCQHEGCKRILRVGLVRDTVSNGFQLLIRSRSRSSSTVKALGVILGKQVRLDRDVYLEMRRLSLYAKFENPFPPRCIRRPKIDRNCSCQNLDYRLT